HAAIVEAHHRIAARRQRTGHEHELAVAPHPVLRPADDDQHPDAGGGGVGAMNDPHQSASTAGENNAALSGCAHAAAASVATVLLTISQFTTISVDVQNGSPATIAESMPTPRVRASSMHAREAGGSSGVSSGWTSSQVTRPACAPSAALSLTSSSRSVRRAVRE